MKIAKKILATCALPYANGSIHLGHIVEYIQADIWVRFQKLTGRDCLFICGEDAHGTPIMLSAQQKGITPEALIAEMQNEHQKDIVDFLIEFDEYYTTHSDENREFSTLIYEKLKARGDIIKKNIRQAFDPKEKMFLPDRYVKGECPKCHTPNQYGDNCENCGATYSPMDLKNPISVLSGETPIEKESEHYFLDLTNYTTFLKEWTQAPGHLQDEVRNKINEWIKVGLQAWDISRDAPYFGFNIPDHSEKYFYVWLDAPIGYISIFKHFCAKRKDLNFDEYWLSDKNTDLVHFIGKDIINFHALFWPAILNGSGFRTPTKIFAHGYLTVDGQKMSKSRGTFINARDYLKNLDPEYLRYYFAAKLNSHVEDLDINFADFMQRNNSDLVGKVINIASRCASFIHKYFDGKLSKNICDEKLFQTFVDAGGAIAQAYEQREFNRAVRLIMELADRANVFIDAEKPWVNIKDDSKKQHVQDVCSLGLNLFRLLIIYLKPVLPNTAKKSETFLNISALTWEDRLHPLKDHTINSFVLLLQRITEDQIKELCSLGEA